MLHRVILIDIRRLYLGYVLRPTHCLLPKLRARTGTAAAVLCRPGATRELFTFHYLELI